MNSPTCAHPTFLPGSTLPLFGIQWHNLSTVSPCISCISIAALYSAKPLDCSSGIDILCSVSLLLWQQSLYVDTSNQSSIGALVACIITTAQIFVSTSLYTSPYIWFFQVPRSRFELLQPSKSMFVVLVLRARRSYCKACAHPATLGVWRYTLSQYCIWMIYECIIWSTCKILQVTIWQPA